LQHLLPSPLHWRAASPWRSRSP